MKPILFTILLSTLLVSCGAPPTDAEIETQQKICTLNNQDIWITEAPSYKMYCKKKINPVMDCIEEYTNGLDEKYNNPDTVSNLSEDNFSQVAYTCNNIFGNNK